jgi:hypothetical protein
MQQNAALGWSCTARQDCADLTEAAALFTDLEPLQPQREATLCSGEPRGSRLSGIGGGLRSQGAAGCRKCPSALCGCAAAVPIGRLIVGEIMPHNNVNIQWRPYQEAAKAQRKALLG